jgi:5-(carboxyamino)imidazole ribonucleotide mutase
VQRATTKAAAILIARFYSRALNNCHGVNPRHAFVSSQRFVVKYRMPDPRPIVGVIMGSQSDWTTMQRADEILTSFEVPHECRIVSAHRTPSWMAEYASTAVERGLEVIIAGAGGAAHLPGMVAAQTVVPVIGVPVQSAALNGLDSLLSIVQMPKGIPVATVAIGEAGAANAALLAVAILATTRPELRERLIAYREKQSAGVRQSALP